MGTASHTTKTLNTSCCSTSKAQQSRSFSTSAPSWEVSNSVDCGSRSLEGSSEFLDSMSSDHSISISKNELPRMCNSQVPGRSRTKVSRKRTTSSGHKTRLPFRFKGSSSRMYGSFTDCPGMGWASNCQSVTDWPRISDTSSSGLAAPVASPENRKSISIDVSTDGSNAS